MQHHTFHDRRLPALLAVLLLPALALVGAGPAAALPPSSPSAAVPPSVVSLAGHTVPAADRAPLSNLDHLDFLLDDVPLKRVRGHTTYRVGAVPSVQAPWTYANHNDDGSYTRVGGGSFDPATGYYGQGAFNADDIARTAVVYLRHWHQFGDTASRDHAYQVLRALTYLQTSSGPDAGNVVLWQQFDGTLNPSAIPVEQPDPSDSAESYWLARTIWALGEGYAGFRHTDPVFAAFLQQRLQLSIAALNRQSLSHYGHWDIADGTRVPAWLITGGADASAEAVLGLAAYVSALPGHGGSPARTALYQLATGIAAMSAGSVDQWPYGAILPGTTSRTLWHAWGGLAPAAVAKASTALHRKSLMAAALRDTARFTPQLLTAGGPDNGWTPTPADKTQIAYGVDSRLESLLTTADATGAHGLTELAAVVGGWYFGANRSGNATYDRATGVTFDGVAADGTVNLNSGAESTIHGQLSMLALDAHPRVKAQVLGISSTVGSKGLSVVEAESGTGGSIVTPDSVWTGEANWSGGAYVSLPADATLDIPVPASDALRRVYPVVNQANEPAGGTLWTAGRHRLGRTANGGIGAQGITPAPGKLAPLTLHTLLRPGAHTVSARSSSGVSIDALLIQPLISSVTVAGTGGTTTIYVSAARHTTHQRVAAPSGSTLYVRVYDAHGRQVLLGRQVRAAGTVGPAGSEHGNGDHHGHGRHGNNRIVPVRAGGFTVVTVAAHQAQSK